MTGATGLRCTGVPGSPGRLLVLVAVPAEREALRRGLSGLDGYTRPGGQLVGQPGDRAPIPVDIACTGVGVAAAAAVAAARLTAAGASGAGYTAVLCAGIGGGFAPAAPIGTTVLATESVAADLGADSPEGFLPLDQLDLGPVHLPADPAVLAVLRTALPGAACGPVLTVNTVTGTRAERDRLRRRHPRAVAEAMEGFGVATAAHHAGVAFAELRTIANLVGPRDRAAWRIGDALAGLAAAAAAVAALADAVATVKR